MCISSPNSRDSSSCFILLSVYSITLRQDRMCLSYLHSVYSDNDLNFKEFIFRIFFLQIFHSNVCLIGHICLFLLMGFPNLWALGMPGLILSYRLVSARIRNYHAIFLRASSSKHIFVLFVYMVVCAVVTVVHIRARG